MGVYIKGMEMPKVCGECKMHFLSGDGYVCCLITDRVPKRVGKFADSKTDLDFRWSSIMQVERPKWCPLIEVPEPHGDLIDREKIDYKNYKMHKDGKVLFSDDFFDGITWVNDCIYETPTVIEAE